MDNLTNICEATSQSHDLDNYRPTHRKGKKLLAEKKRRARINHCLMQIRDIVCEGEEEKDTDLEKMEKAEILEKTLEVLTRLRHDYSAPSSSTFSTRKAMAVRYASGFSSCAEESIRYIQNSRLIPSEVKVQLQSHLRAIAHRMETSLQGDSQSLSFTQSYQSSPLLSSPSERLTGLEEIREDKSGSGIERVPEQVSDVGVYYTPSPIAFSTPVVPNHMPLTTAISQQQECVTNTTETFIKHNFSHQEINHTDILPDSTRDVYPQMKPSDEDSGSIYTPSFFQQPQTFPSVSPKEKQFVTSFLSPRSSYTLSAPSLTEAPPTTSSSVILYSTPVLQNTPTRPDQSVFSYHVYETYPTVPNILIQPITYMTTPLRPNMASVSNVAKQSSGLNSALDLCVKRNEEHQISPETMWRPW